MNEIEMILTIPMAIIYIILNTVITYQRKRIKELESRLLNIAMINIIELENMLRRRDKDELE